jgi:hypothetical protein
LPKSRKKNNIFSIPVHSAFATGVAMAGKMDRSIGAVAHNACVGAAPRKQGQADVRLSYNHGRSNVGPRLMHMLTVSP